MESPLFVRMPRFSNGQWVWLFANFLACYVHAIINLKPIRLILDPLLKFLLLAIGWYRSCFYILQLEYNYGAFFTPQGMMALMYILLIILCTTCVQCCTCMSNALLKHTQIFQRSVLV